MKKSLKIIISVVALIIVIACVFAALYPKNLSDENKRVKFSLKIGDGEDSIIYVDKVKYLPLPDEYYIMTGKRDSSEEERIYVSSESNDNIVFLKDDSEHKYLVFLNEESGEDKYYIKAEYEAPELTSENVKYIGVFDKGETDPDEMIRKIKSEEAIEKLIKDYNKGKNDSDDGKDKTDYDIYFCFDDVLKIRFGSLSKDDVKELRSK